MASFVANTFLYPGHSYPSPSGELLVLTSGRGTELPIPGFGSSWGEALPWLVALK